jgi:NAD/NADP transhydrogenase beta subunit
MMNSYGGYAVACIVFALQKEGDAIAGQTLCAHAQEL